ncbi:MAG TPA: hypothetical protein DEH78_27145 [Solibacterales bacterium]|nr:hypothetical protein [Bryobacterales bacterium]
MLNRMMRAAVVLLAAGAAYGQPAMSIGERVQLRSELLNEQRHLVVVKPAGYDASRERYPALYLLDGDEHYFHTAGLLAFLARNGRMPNVLLVAVSTLNRNRDLTPPSEDENEKRFFPQRGGADLFLRHMEEELIPFVEKTYRVRPYRILVGHSLGGLFALHALTGRPALFQGWVAISPSVQWNKLALVARMDEFLRNTPELAADLYLATGDEGGTMLSGLRRVCASLGERSPRGLRWNFRQFEDENHVTVPHAATYSALTTIFDQWDLTSPMAEYERLGLEGIHKRFREASKRYGVERKLLPFTLSLIVAGLIERRRLEEAEELLLHDPKSYPAPWNQLDALARGYSGRGDKAGEIRCYRLSLERNPSNEWARKRLAELGAGAP